TPVVAEQASLPETAAQENKIAGDLAVVSEEVMPETETGRENTLTQGQWERLGDALRELGLHEQTADQIKNGELDPKEVLQLVRQFVQKAGQSDASDQTLHKVLGGREFQELLKQEIGRQWTIEPKDVADKKQVEQLYERIREQTARLSQALDTAGKGDAPVARSVQNLQNNVDFMNQMNHLYTYVQLPLKMLGNNAHGDLYVYTNKKSLAAKDGQVSALLHLDMEHLGPLDVYVTMKDKQVATNFTVMDDSILDLIGKHIDILNKRLEDRGYSLKTQMHVKEENAEEEETSIMQTLLHQQKNISVLSRTSFDMRA
ncbi:MAG: flagellar hook-length control protein FliK, partial [Lachnospiraceae bacterium]|nr:flagellar hook-length control protein FliK [Lachnospiraceae bacterium]